MEGSLERAKIPVTIITGFLGSGKTTVLNRLLHDSRLSDAAVIVNEFGEIGLDHLLVESAIDQMVLMDNGCLCCSVRGDLVDTLEDMLRRVDEGKIPAFRRVLIETTGLADPAPIVQTLVTDAATAARFQLHGIVATIDGVCGIDTLQGYDEARCQAAMADLLLITKADHVDADVTRVEAAVSALNPQADIVTIENGEVDPDKLFAISLSTSDRAINLEPGSVDPVGHDHHRHGWNIQSASIVIDEPLDWSNVTDWLTWLTSLRGPDVLRIKGLLRVKGIAGPVLIHGVQHVFYPPHELANWPSDDHRSRLVIIARDIPEAALRRSFDIFKHERSDKVA
ncbi:MAG: GTP-binding protein [Hyphomicrobiaceae bacterium]